MLVQCNSISGVDVPEDQRGDMIFKETRYSPLQVGSLLSVFGIIFYQNRQDYLLCPDGGPLWAPACLFSVTDSTLSEQMHFSLLTNNGDYYWLVKDFKAVAMIGYRKLIESPQHFAGLLEREEEDLIYFYKHVRRTP